jgi:hypothetical protein
VVVSYDYAVVALGCAHLQSIDARCRLYWARRLGRTVGGNVQKQVLLLSIRSWCRGRGRRPSAMRRVVVFHSAAGAGLVVGRFVGGARHSSRWGPRTAGRGSSGQEGSGAAGRVYSAWWLVCWSRGFSTRGSLLVVPTASARVVGASGGNEA